jgi:hypothetical protein
MSSYLRLRLLDRYLPHAENELQANSWKGDHWRDQPADELAFEVLYHAAKLAIAVRLGDTPASVLEYAADMANCAAMVADNLDLLDQPPRNLDDAAPVEYDGVGGTDLKHHIRDHHESLKDFVPGTKETPDA